MVEVELKVKVRYFNLNTGKLLYRAAVNQAGRIQERIKVMSEPANSSLTKSVKGSSGVLKDTGLLMTSIGRGVKVNETVATIGTNRTGARLQHYGGEITPKKAKLLWIPANKKAKVACSHGSVAEGLRSLKSQGYVFYKSKKGKAFLGYKKGSKNPRPEVFFILKKSITVPARPFMFFSEDDKRDVRRLMKKAVLDESAKNN